MIRFDNRSGLSIYMGFAENAKSRFHSDVELIYVLDGEICVTVDGADSILCKEDIIVINAGSFHSVINNGNGVIFNIFVQSSLFYSENGNKRPRFLCNTVLAPQEHDNWLRSLLNEILRQYLVQKESNLDQLSLCYRLAGYLVRHYSVEMEKIDDFASSDNIRVRDALIYMHENFTQPLTLTDLSEQLHLSSGYLSRYLKKHLGTNFKDYLTQIRLSHATEDLENSKKSVLHVALDNGFANLNLFNSSFKAKHNMTPSQYRSITQSYENKEKNEQTERERLLLEDIKNEYRQTEELSNDMTLMENINVLVSRKAEKPWKSMFNVGAMVDLLNSGIQKHILWMKSEINFKYVRFWGIFPESIKVKQEGGFDINFSRLDHAINFLLQNGLKPFMQLGPKPRTIIKDDGQYILEDFGHANPDDYSDERWESYIDILMRHLIAEFDISEVESWIFEMWCPCPWDKPWEHWYSDQKYEIFYRLIKQYSPDSLVGGCEFERRVHEQQLHESAKYWKENDIVPDFVSFSLFLDEVKHNGDVSRLEQTSDANFFLDEVTHMRQMLQNLKLEGTKLFLSLWNMTVSNRNIFNDTCFKGAWILKNMIDIAELVDVAGYWLISDMYGTANNPTSTLFGGAALLTKDGISKPSFYAFQFMEKARELFIKKSENYYLSKDRHGNFTLLFHNMQTYNFTHLYKNPQRTFKFGDLSYIFDTTGTLKLQFTLTGVTPGKYYLRTYSVSKHHGSVLDEREKWDSEIELHRADCEYLKQICVPAVDIAFITSDSDSITLQIDVLPNEFGLLEILRQY